MNENELHRHFMRESDVMRDSNAPHVQHLAALAKAKARMRRLTLIIIGASTAAAAIVATQVYTPNDISSDDDIAADLVAPNSGSAAADLACDSHLRQNRVVGPTEGREYFDSTRALAKYYFGASSSATLKTVEENPVIVDSATEPQIFLFLVHNRLGWGVKFMRACGSVSLPPMSGVPH